MEFRDLEVADKKGAYSYMKKGASEESIYDRDDEEQMLI